MHCGVRAGSKQQVAAATAGRAGYRFIHTALDDRTRLAYSEIHHDETGSSDLRWG